MVLLVLRAVLAVVAAFLVVTTLLPLSDSKHWWIRMWDFPRTQIAIGLALLVVVSPFVFGGLGWPLALVLLACLAYQVWRIFPYTPLARTEMTLAPEAPDGFTLLAANILMENREHEKVRDLIRRTDPDVLLLLEPDATWVEALEPVLSGYPTVVRHPRDDCYGMVFATRLEAPTARTERLTEDETPALLAELVAPDGRTFRFIGLHPKPPVPGIDSDERDAEILYAARFAQKSAVPLVVMGDFNDVAWSHTSHRFKRVGGYLDPRVGRGRYASFDANRWWFRCPIDQIFVTETVVVQSFRLGDYTGSDHFPLIARVSLDPDRAAQLNRPPARLTDDENARIDETVEAWRLRLGAPRLDP